MPKINMEEYNAATETNGGGFAQMTPGAYVLRIQAIRTEGTTRSGKWTSEEKQYVQVIWDIDEGPFAGHYSDDYFTLFDGTPNPDRDFIHCHYMSWKNYGFLKKQLRILTESNPGFDALAAFEADRWGMFIGKKFGAVLDGEVDTNDRGYDRWKFEIGELITVEDVHSGNHREPKVTDKRTQAVDNGGAYDDVPFI